LPQLKWISLQIYSTIILGKTTKDSSTVEVQKRLI
jgi:hypothetical protein